MLCIVNSQSQLKGSVRDYLIRDEMNRDTLV